MKAPPYLLGATLWFWGWQTGNLIVGGAAGSLLEIGRARQWHWDLAEADYTRLWDFCTVLFVGCAIYFYTSEEITQSAYSFFQWLPLTLYPMMLAQWLGPWEKIPYRTFAWLLRRKKAKDPPHWNIEISYLFFAFCLLGVSAINSQTIWFYVGFTLLAGWALWGLRPQRYPAWTWGLLLLVVTGLGFQSHRSLHALQGVLEGRFSIWIFSLLRRDPDSTETYTAIGQVGKLQLSGRIKLRLATDGRSPPPTLLRQASYNQFKQPSWHASYRTFQAATPETNDAWNMLPPAKATRWLESGGFFRQGKGILALPMGAARIENLPSQTLEFSPLGAVRVDQGPGFANFRTYYGSKETMDISPEAVDLEVPEAELPALAQISAELQLSNQAPAEVMRRIDRFFQKYFQYSSYLGPEQRVRPGETTPLTRFLTKTRSGHCEYFATATTLLLRAAGIPARYAVGFAVMESNGRHKFVVRERHAHAWTLVFRRDKNAWEDFDTTPASWSLTEGDRASFFEPLRDFWSKIWYEFNRWRYGKASIRNYILLLLIPLAGTLAWGLIFRKRRSQTKARQRTAAQPRSFPGQDSEFFLIEQRLGALGLPRDAHETAAQFLQRLETEQTLPAETLLPIAQLHYRYRFDPNGLSTAERQALKSMAEQWLKNQPVNRIG